MENVKRTTRTITGGELALLLCGLALGIAVSIAGAAFGSRLMPNPNGILGFLGVLLLGVAAPSFLSLVVGVSLPSWRYKLVCGVLLLFGLMGLGVHDALDSVSRGFMPFVGGVIRFSVSTAAALAALNIWRRLRESRRSSEAPLMASGVGPSTEKPRTPIALLLLSLVSIPLTYAAVALSMFVTIGFTVLLFLIVEELPRVPAFVLLAMLVAPALAVWAAAQAIRRILAPPAGMQQAVIIPLEDRAGLRALVSDVCRRVGSRMPENVLLQAGPVFYVTQARMSTFDGVVRGRTVALGAPILPQLSAGELGAVLAHEFAHFSGRDVLYSRFSYRAYQGLETSLQTLVAAHDQRQSAASWVLRVLQLPAIHLLVSSYEYFRSIDMILSRRRELRADWIAARTCGKEPFSSALRKCTAIDAHFSKSLKSIRWSDERAFFSAYAGLVRCEEASLEGFSKEGEAVVETELSSHPSIRTRLDSLPPFPAEQAAEISGLRTELTEDEGRLSVLFAPLVALYQKGLSESGDAGASESPPDGSRTESTANATICPSCGRTVVPTFQGTCPECHEFIS